MLDILTAESRQDLLKRGFSRRNLGKIATMITAGAALPFYNEPALAQLSRVGNLPPDAVLINANENPLGPCSEAADAIHSIVQRGGRYLYSETDALRKTLADVEGVKPEYVAAYPGSSQPLHQAVLAFCSKDKPFVMGDPGYEAGGRAADFIGAKTVRVPLTKDYTHDVKAMVAAHPTPGLIYLCNPNNPTGTINKKEDIDWIANNLPKGSILLLDEAYIHLSPSATPGSYLVAADKDVIILRTFSKLYGMAGLRAGAAMGRPDLLAKVMPYGAGALPVTGVVGATTSLKVKNLVPVRRKIIGDTREDVFSFLTKNNVKFIPSESNKFMMDVKRPGKDFFAGMLKEKVVIGRTWPVWPNYVRVSIGTPEEMAKFKAAFLKVYNT